MMRNVVIRPVEDKAILGMRRRCVTADVRAPGGIEGTGTTVIVEHTTDNLLVKFRFPHAKVEMQRRGGGVRGRRPEVPRRRVHHSERQSRGARADDEGARDLRVRGRGGADGADARSRRAAHRLRHTRGNTQDEGWVRAALDTYGVPYTYFGDIKLREGNLRAKYDVIL